MADITRSVQTIHVDGRVYVDKVDLAEVLRAADYHELADSLTKLGDGSATETKEEG